MAQPKIAAADHTAKIASDTRVTKRASNAKDARVAKRASNVKDAKSAKKHGVRSSGAGRLLKIVIAPAVDSSRIESFARQVWGNAEDAARWLDRPHPLLDGATPRSRLVSKAGRNQVEEILAALDNGFPV